VSRVVDLTARTLQLERERDQLRQVNCKLRDKILEVCKQCAECGGTGVVTVVGIRRGVNCEYQQPCADCADLREVLEP
jgi:DnaJ-class molecular chaperone